jgi:hypothetical protein
MISNEAKTYKFTHECRECGEKFTSNRAEAESCSTVCRKAYNNRRAVRGAILYDIMMCKRFGRKDMKLGEKEARKLIDNLTSAYRRADKHYRKGRKSWDPLAFERLPIAFDEKGGDNR